MKKQQYVALSLAIFASSILLSVILFGLWKGLGVILLLMLFGWGMNLDNRITNWS